MEPSFGVVHGIFASQTYVFCSQSDCQAPLFPTIQAPTLGSVRPTNLVEKPNNVTQTENIQQNITSQTGRANERPSKCQLPGLPCSSWRHRKRGNLWRPQCTSDSRASCMGGTPRGLVDVLVWRLFNTMRLVCCFCNRFVPGPSFFEGAGLLGRLSLRNPRHSSAKEARFHSQTPGSCEGRACWRKVAAYLWGLCAPSFGRYGVKTELLNNLVSISHQTHA